MPPSDGRYYPAMGKQPSAQLISRSMPNNDGKFYPSMGTQRWEGIPIAGLGGYFGNGTCLSLRLDQIGLMFSEYPNKKGTLSVVIIPCDFVGSLSICVHNVLYRYPMYFSLLRFILELTSQVQQVYYVNDHIHGNWQVVVKTNPRSVCDEPEEDEEDTFFVAIPEDTGEAYIPMDSHGITVGTRVYAYVVPNHVRYMTDLHAAHIVQIAIMVWISLIIIALGLDNVLDYPSISVAVLIGLTLFHVLRWLTNRGKLPPGPFPLPVIGNLHLIGGKWHHQGLARLAEKYGPVMNLKLGTVNTVIISSAEVAREALQKKDSSLSSRRPLPNALAGGLNYLGNSVVWLPVSPKWRALRKLVHSNIFSPLSLDSNQHLRDRKIRDLILHCQMKSQKERMRIYIRSINFQLWLVIKNSEEIPMKKVGETTVPKTEDEFDAEDIKKVENYAKAINILYCAVNPDDYRKISCCTTAKEMWESKFSSIQFFQIEQKQLVFHLANQTHMVTRPPHHAITQYHLSYDSMRQYL
ncbi:unnamed protein product [Cuscuta campestris]|uniref:Cytochrome P450 n=1 Tax=Cuscuta campestris TaxID=132261 RepID=A0A484LEA2_9ASTE|nr:unnamed protein product [Cuscuta campestris]